MIQTRVINEAQYRCSHIDAWLSTEIEDHPVTVLTDTGSDTTLASKLKHFCLDNYIKYSNDADLINLT